MHLSLDGLRAQMDAATDSLLPAICRRWLPEALCYSPQNKKEPRVFLRVGLFLRLCNTKFLSDVQNHEKITVVIFSFLP